MRLGPVYIPPEVQHPRPEDIERAVRVIESEELLIGSAIICAHAGHCAMGSLLFAAGLSNVEMIDLDGDPAGFTEKAQRLLWNTYRIGELDAHAIVNANDSVDDEEEVGNPQSKDNVDNDFLKLHNKHELPDFMYKGFIPTAENMAARKELVIETIRETMAAQKERDWAFMRPEEYDETPW